MGKYTDDSLRPLTEYNKRFSSLCIYCKDSTGDSREHIPPRIFLDKPYPEDYGIVPSCIACNNGFSQDELYVSCFVDQLRYVLTNSKISIRQKTLKAFEHDKKLQLRIYSEIYVLDKKVIVKPDYDAFHRILIKLGKGHACQEQDFIISDKCEVVCGFKFRPDFNDSEMHNFEEMPIIDKAGEVGSNNTHSLYIVEGTGIEPFIVAPWIEVQENNYRFLTYYKSHTFFVRMHISAHPDGYSGGIRTVKRKHPDTLPGNLIL